MQKTNDVNSQMLSLLIDSAKIINNGVMWLNAEGHILAVNNQFANELGYASNELFQPKSIFEVNPSTSILSWKKNWKKLLKEKQLAFETEQITSDNAIYPVRMKCILLEVEKEIICMSVVENLMKTNRYKDLLKLSSEIAGIGNWEWDLVKDKFLLTNEVYRLLDLPSSITVNKSTFERLTKKRLNEQEQTLLKKNITLAIKEAKAFEMELSVEVGGRYESFYLHVKPVWLEGQTIKLYGTLQNLSGVTQRTDDLYFTKFCMENAREMILWVEKDGTITYVNQATCDKLGYESDELLEKNIKFIAPYSEIDFDAHWKELKKEKSLEFESVHVSKKEQKIPVSIIANYFNYRGREFNCCFVRDLSIQKKRDEVIAMAKHTLDNSRDMIFWLNFDGSFKYFNDAFVEKTGYNRNEIQHMKAFDFLQNGNIENFQKNWQKLQNGAEMEGLDRNLKTKTGAIIPCELTVTLVEFEGYEFSSNVLRNVSDRRKKEQQITRQLEEIEKLQQITHDENVQLKEAFELEYNFSKIISRDPNYKKILRQVEQVADTETTVLILGETGTGKELLARAIHQLSSRYDKPLIKINCGALPENLIESELFGHEKGAFTGAYQQKIGKFERAHKGTVFLDEIGELPLDLQTKLLRVLQEGEIERVGGTSLIQIDARVLAATNRNLEKLVAEGKFREDLFYRLNVFPIHNIPLRERREDIPILVKHFTEKYSKRMNKPIKEISQAGLNKLMAYDFLGNVRELENLIERAVILAKSDVLTFNFPLRSKPIQVSTRFKTMEELQKNHIINALKRANGKVSGKMGAAELLGMNDKTLASRMKKLGIQKLDYLKKHKLHN